MAVAGVSTQSSPFRHSTTSPPSILFSSYSIRRSLSVFSAFTPRPSSTFDRQEIHSQGSDAHSCDVTRVGSTKAVRASSSVYKITLNNGVHDPAYYSLPSSQKPEPPFSPINTNPYNSRSSLLGPSGTGIARENDCGNSKVPAFDLKYLCSRESWSRESQRNKYLRTSYQLCQNIVNGCCPDLQDGIAYKTENISTTFPSYHNTNALAEKYAIQDSSTQEYGNYSKKSSGALMGSASASHRQMQMGVNKTPLGCRVTLPSEDFFNKQSESPTQTVSNGALINKPLPQKRVAVGEEVLEMDGHRSNGAIEMNTDNIECPIPTPSSQTSTKLTGRQGDQGICKQDHKKRLNRIYDKVRVIDNVSSAREVVQMLTTKYKKFVHACDTEVAKIDVKQDTPVGHGEIICFSVFSGSDESKADFGDGKNCIWVDVLDGGRDVLMEFAKFFEDPLIKKVWHNYSFDSHVIENYGIKVSGFHADTMHLARLWDSSRGIDGGYSLEALTSDQSIMHLSQSGTDDELTVGKISMKSIFGKKKLKKDGSEGKIITIAPVETLQREERILWICYSALDSISTLKLFQMLKGKLIEMPWIFDGGKVKGSMYDFYGKYWQPFGKLLVEMESEGMLVDRAYLAEIEKVASVEQKVAADRFRNWASKYCPDAKYMNVGSDNQIRQLLFGGVLNRKKQNDCLPESKTFKVPNVDNVVEEGKKSPLKYRNITLHCLKREIFKGMQTEMYTASGWPSVSGGALKGFAGKIASDQIYLVDGDEDFQSDSNKEVSSGQISLDDADKSTYGTAYAAFGGNKEGMEACHAIAALCEVCSIDSLISNFILPLQGDHISGHNGRIHCSLNINTETGRLSARRPNLQNQPALEKDRYKIRQAFIAAPGNSLIVADYGQLELRILAHLANCKSMLDAFKAGGDFHSRTAMNMYPHVREAVKEKRVLLEWHPQPGEDKPPVPLLKDAFAAERRKAKMLNFSIAYGKTPVGLSKDWKVSLKEAKETVKLWYKERQEVLKWQQKRKEEAREQYYVNTLLGRARRFPSTAHASNAQKGHIERAAINTPVQGSAADVAMCAMLQITKNDRLKDLKWKLLLQVHDEVILEGPTESAEEAKAIVVECMSKPFDGHNILNVDLSVDAKCAQNWYAAK